MYLSFWCIKPGKYLDEHLVYHHEKVGYNLNTPVHTKQPLNETMVDVGNFHITGTI